MAAFALDADDALRLFAQRNNKINIFGTHAVSVNVTGNFTVATELDVSGKSVNVASNDKPLFVLGGFVRINHSCCSLGKLSI